jgi:Tol biopolymer transport system component
MDSEKIAAPEERSDEKPLEGWKEIAAYLNRGVRTVKRWEKSEGLPVRRHLHQARASVSAYPSELEAWKAGRSPVEDSAADESWLWSPAARRLATAAMLLLTLLTIGGGRIFVPSTNAASSGAGPAGIVARRIWAGPDVDPMGRPSHDGKLLSFVDWSTGDLAVRDLAAKANRRLTNKGPWTQSDEFAEFSTISPDGKLVAYAWFNEKFYELRLASLDSTAENPGPRVLHRQEDLTYVQPAAWSADGKHLVCVFSRRDLTNQLALVGIADGTVRVLKTFDWRYPQNPSLSPDGRWIVYDFPPKEETFERDVFLLAADGSREIPVVRHPAHDFVLGWAPGGEQVIFASDRTGSVSMWTQPVTGGRPHGAARLLRPDLGRVFPIGFDGHGAFYYGVGGDRDVFAATLDLASGRFESEPENLATRYIGTNYGADWSPDGKSVVFISHRGPPRAGLGAQVLVIRSLETGEERVLNPLLNLARGRSFPRWSPAGESILVTGRDAKGRRGFYRVSVETGEASPLVRIGAEQEWAWPVWSPDGKALYFQRYASGPERASLVRRDLETGREIVVARARHIQAWALSPDGRHIAYSTDDPARQEQQYRSDLLMLVPASGGPPAPAVLYRAPGQEEIQAVVWTPDSSAVLFLRQDEKLGESSAPRPVWRIPAVGGVPHPLELALRPRQLEGLRFHPDGRRVVFPVYDSRHPEIWVLENFLPH